MEIKRVLFVCTYHGARSQIAEAFINLIAQGKIKAHSSCFEQGKIGPLVIDVVREIGVDISSQGPKSVFERYIEGDSFDYVISLCHEASTEQCPTFKKSVDTLYSDEAERIIWSIPDFKSLSGTEEEKKVKAREIRDKIKSEVILFLAQMGIETDIA
jgi:arsenate reductase